MKLKTRLIIAFLITMFLPAILFGVSGWRIIQYQSESIQEEYGLSIDTYGILSNPLQVLNKLTRGTYNKIFLTARETPEKFESLDFIKELDEDLKSSYSYIILRKGEDVIYRGSEKDSDLKKYLPKFGEFDTDIEGGFYIDANTPVLLKQQDFYFKDGSEGSIFIITDARNLIPQIKSSFIQLLFAYMVVTLLTAVVVVYWIYLSIIKPLNILRIATSEITKGNLNFSIEGDFKDEIGQLSVDFEEMRIRIKELLELRLENEVKTKELVGNITHDLKTPITAIKGYSEGIMDGVADTPDKQRKYIETIYNKANTMSTLVDELLLYSKIENNKIEYHHTKLNIDDFFSDCIEEVSLDLELKNISISYENKIDKSIYILADPEQLKKVTNNIIMNSVKYITNKKGIINIESIDDNEHIQICISDNGIGISVEDLPYVFERFYRSDESRNTTKGGSGLGLSIAKKIVEDHDGEIWARAQEGKGTCIYIRFRKYEVA